MSPASIIVVSGLQTITLDAASVLWSESVQLSEEASMEVTLPPDLRKQVQQELASGRYRNADELIEHAVRQFLDERQRGQQRLDALRRIGQAVDEAGLYERVVIPDKE